MSVLNAVIPNAIYSNQLGNGNQCAGGRFGGRSETAECLPWSYRHKVICVWCHTPMVQMENGVPVAPFMAPLMTAGGRGGGGGNGVATYAYYGPAYPNGGAPPYTNREGAHMYPAYQPADAYGSGVHEEYEDDQVAIPPPLKFKSSTTPESAEAEGEGEGESEGRKKVQKKVVKKVKKKVEKKIEKKGTTDKRRNFRPVRQNGKGASAPPSGWDSEDSFMRSDSGSED